jgi:hypothetical protein
MVRTEVVEAIEELAEQTGEDVTELASTLLNEALYLIGFRRKELFGQTVGRREK